MKIVVFIGGLGNQIFEYAFIQTFIRRNFPNHSIFGVYDKKKLSEHYGLEIDKWFDVDLPQQKWWLKILVGFLYVYKQIAPKTGLLDLNLLDCVNKNALLFYPSKFNKKYVPNNPNWIKWKIDESNLDEKNKSILNKIRLSYSVFIHVRRGDYLSPNFRNLFEGCCTLDYYNKAISYVMKKYPNAVFFCFSDDVEWVKFNLPLQEATYVDWNNDTDSPLDMYLMCNCKGAIIANSTFSYWGARLLNAKEFVCYPKHWINGPQSKQDIIPEEWIGFD